MNGTRKETAALYRTHSQAGHKLHPIDATNEEETTIKDEEAVYRARAEPERLKNEELGRGPYIEQIT
jgi:hypothetical protein